MQNRPETSLATASSKRGQSWAHNASVAPGKGLGLRRRKRDGNGRRKEGLSETARCREAPVATKAERGWLVARKEPAIGTGREGEGT